ncbi:MAG: hypothetical protein PHW12_09640 [Smithella sp.]|nr:hypothetical protein [Smithella sp.]MDD5503171.1 hypothetical protein [Candidatus Thermoplasmatota archaeon]
MKKDLLYKEFHTIPPDPVYEAGIVELAEFIKKEYPSLCNKETTGIYLVSEDAGAEASVSLWREALANTPRFANPSAFPFTVPCSSAGYLSILCGIQGPNYTYFGKKEALEYAKEEMRSDYLDGIIDTGLLIQLEMNAERGLKALIQVLSSLHR